MFLFSISIGIVALVLGGVAISRTNMPAPIVPTVNNNFPPAPSPPSAPTPVSPQPVPVPATQQSLLVPNTATGNQDAYYFLSFYNGDPTCSQVSKVYNQIADPLSIGLYSNPIRIDKSQSACFPIAYGISFGVVAGTARYLSFRQFASNDCSGTYQDYVRLIVPSVQTPSTSCFVVPLASAATQLYYKVTIANPSVNALNYPLPGFGHESFDYDPLSAKFWLGSVYSGDVYAMDPVRSAQAARPTSFGGVGYPGVEQFPLNQIGFTGIDVNPSVPFNFVGLRSAGECARIYHFRVLLHSPHTPPPLPKASRSTT